MNRTQAIGLSIRAFGFGVASLLLPGLGIALGAYALFCWARVSYRFGAEWNPARGYLSVGAFLATLALLLHILLALAIAVSLV